MSFAQAFHDLRTRPVCDRGFSLIELMIVVAIIGAIAAFAIPNYRNYNMRANRSAAAQVMLTIQNREEAYLLDARAYTSALNSTGLNIAQDGWTCTAASCVNNFYTVTVTLPSPQTTPPTYTITATPISGKYQTADGNLTLTSTGVKSRSAGDGKW